MSAYTLPVLGLLHPGLLLTIMSMYMDRDGCASVRLKLVTTTHSNPLLTGLRDSCSGINILHSRHMLCECHPAVCRAIPESVRLSLVSLSWKDNSRTLFHPISLISSDKAPRSGWRCEPTRETQAGDGIRDGKRWVLRWNESLQIL